MGVAFLGWLFIESTKPLPGEKQAYNCDNFVDFSKLGDLNTSDKCRVHVPPGTEVKYNSNPPVFGPHYGDWIRAGVYTEVKDDRNLVHSLEHGYVIMSYRCNTSVIASGAKQSSSSGEIASGSANPRKDDVNICDQRKSQLEAVYNKKGKKKLIVVPRPNLDSNFALSAWQYLDKFDSFDQSRVEKFIDAHLENGPERTME